MKTKKNNSSLACSILLIIVSIIFGFTAISKIHKMREVPLENKAYIGNLGIGYNIGNALDVCDWEAKFENKYGIDTQTLWLGENITEDFIKMLAYEGFGVVRVPVTYMNHIDEDANVDEAWLSRVREVADWIINNDMYCIIDIHHDTGNDGWIMASSDNYEENHERVINMITQIANYFKDYDEHLILEGFNEIVDEENHWTRIPLKSLEALNDWNQLFVDTVRATGGNNSSRYLLINTYAAIHHSWALYCFDMPKDSVENRLIVGVHNYSGPDKLESSFKRIKRLSDRGYPVIIGEFGSKANANFDRVQHAHDYVVLAKSYGFCPIWWDNGENPDKHSDSSFALFDRKSCDTYFEDIVNALTD